jgi:hypothetical protein
MSHDPEDLGPDAESFRHVLDVGASLDAVDFERVDPPADLWDRIASRLDAPATPSVIVETAEDVGDDGFHGVDTLPAEPSDDGSPVVDLAAHRRRRMTRVAVASAAVIAVLAGVGVAVNSLDDDAPQVVATSTLEVLEGPATAEAELVSVDGEQRLVVRAEDMPPAPAGSHYELWLVDPEVTDPRSLGPMTGSTEVTVPETIDTDEFPVVDISLQEDGTVEHSGHSLLRGTLS